MALVLCVLLFGYFGLIRGMYQVAWDVVTASMCVADFCALLCVAHYVSLLMTEG